MSGPIITFLDPQPIPSPCINICSMDGAHCEGCRRTLDEIARWTTMPAAERAAIMAELKARQAGAASFAAASSSRVARP